MDKDVVEFLKAIYKRRRFHPGRGRSRRTRGRIGRVSQWRNNRPPRPDHPPQPDHAPLPTMSPPAATSTAQPSGSAPPTMGRDSGTAEKIQYWVPPTMRHQIQYWVPYGPPQQRPLSNAGAAQVLPMCWVPCCPPQPRHGPPSTGTFLVPHGAPPPPDGPAPTADAAPLVSADTGAAANGNLNIGETDTEVMNYE